MNKEGIIGIISGLALTLLGMSLFILFFSKATFYESFQHLYIEKKLGALISLGALLNLPLFFIFLHKNRYQMAYGLVGVLILLVGIVALLKFV